MSTLEAPPAPPSDSPEPPEPSSPSVATAVREAPQGVGAPVVTLRFRSVSRRLLRRSARWVGRTVWMVTRWTGTVALVGATVAAAAVVVTRSAGHLVSHSATAVPSKPITFDLLPTRSVVYARDGSVLSILHAEEDRVPIPLDQVPPHVVQAVLDAEDERFFEHGPLDLRAILRAAVSNIEAGSVTEGGSTITQQLVKTELLTAKKDVDRKLKEAVLAIQLEKQYTKHQILERYLNTVYFGNGAYGIQAAAERYYGVGAGGLTKGQAVLLAGLIRYPGGSDPFVNPEAARERRVLVTDRMRFLGHLTAEEAEQIKGEPLPTPPPPAPPKSSDYFAERVKQELLAADWLGETPQERYRAVFEGGLSIHTTLDPHAQGAAEEAVSSLLPEDPRGFNAALVAVEPATGAVRSLVGGKSFDQVKFNLVTDGDGRQTGSSFKTFTLLAALESGFLPIDTISGEAPCPIANPGSVDPVWAPANVEGQGAGVMTLSAATVSSVNCAYARLIKLVGPEKVVDVARRMGVTNPLGAHLSLTLGSETVTPLQMASAYATLAADGVRHQPYFVERVLSRDGTEIFRRGDSAERVISEQNSRLVTQVLNQVVQSGTGTAAALPGRPAAGKTGSTDDNADAWFVGFTPQLATAVWMGAPEGRVSMYNVGSFPRVYGGTYPAMMWRAFMSAVHDGQPVQGFPAPGPLARGPQALELNPSQTGADLPPQTRRRR